LPPRLLHELARRGTCSGLVGPRQLVDEEEARAFGFRRAHAGPPIGQAGRDQARAWYATGRRRTRPTESHMRVISADSHVLEPPHLWTRRLAAGRFADRAPHVDREPETGAHRFLIDGLAPQPISLPGAAGTASEELRETGSIDDARTGGWDLSARLA